MVISKEELPSERNRSHKCSLSTGGHPNMCLMEYCGNDASWRLSFSHHGVGYVVEICQVHAHLIRAVRLAPFTVKLPSHEEHVIQPQDNNWQVEEGLHGA